ncbi:hypothetical protein GCM10008995_27190 [Halobellus salinus]|uniref:Uncharacterized protein n=1 Tax=Halobellus salinus TaxID=931585 RepID=A0A830EJB4_9EURY|nr:hypothetical protein [Halobellus salinus]GGJ15875.1 hypothetical protein GCM10008995_27190 [Halobellus salinus]SMP30192.1 hypothetical protein SAMN06265347_1168 [Halobellus salinus]
MSPDPPDPDEDLPELLDDLEATLAELRTELQDETPDRRDPPIQRGRRGRTGRDSAFPRPPSVSELLGFTEQYTLPTLISTLEATIRALELLRGTLRALDPDRSTLGESGRKRGTSTASRLGRDAAGIGRDAVSGVERALSELDAALAESDVPDDRASSELLDEARGLSAEVRDRLDTAQGTADRGGRQGDEVDRPAGAGPNARSSGVEIEVTGDGHAPETDADDRAREDRPEVDVEAELKSIRHEVRGDDGADAADEAATGDHSASAGESDGDAPDGADRTGDVPDGADRTGDAPDGDGGEGDDNTQSRA